MAKVTLENMNTEIAKVLEKYGDEVRENVEDATVAVGKIGVKTLKNEASTKFGGTGKYAKGWRATTEQTRIGTVVILHNKDLPGLPHLLEHGHAMRGGGRVPGRVHIKPVEDQLMEEFEQEVRAKL